MVMYFFAFLWGFVLLAAFAGYGALLGSLLKIKPPDNGLAVAWGMAFIIVAGGALNLARVISSGLIVGIVFGGVAAWFFLGGSRRLRERAQNLSVWDVLLLAVMMLGYVNWMCFNQPEPPPRTQPGAYSICVSDDGGYTLGPVEMLETGGMTIDPYCDHLTASGLGGESFLQTFVLAILPVEYIHLVDPGLAFLGMAVMFLTTRMNPAPRFALALLFATIPCNPTNASAAVIPVFLFVALARNFSRNVRQVHPISSTVCPALLLAATITLKSTLVSLGVAFVFFWQVYLALLTSRIKPIAIGAMIGMLAFLMALPYMVRSYQASRTLFYPVLGPGYREHTLALMPQETAFRNPARPALWQKLGHIIPKPQILMLLGAVGIAVSHTLLRRTSIKRRALVLSCCTAGVLNIIIIIAIFEVGEFWRYSYVARCFMAVVCFGVLLRVASRCTIHVPLRIVIYTMVLSSIAYYGTRVIADSRELPDVVYGALTGRLRFTPAERDQYRRLQASIPAGHPFLCYLPWPLMFDHARNPIYYPSNIGSISPPPGIPLDRGPDEFAEYLRCQGLNYVACPDRTECERLYREREKDAEALFRPKDNKCHNLWVYSVHLNNAKAYKLFIELASRFQLLYENDNKIVIDLNHPVRPASGVSP